jgi:membrane fusion protein, multidrug efflux system
MGSVVKPHKWLLLKRPWEFVKELFRTYLSKQEYDEIHATLAEAQARRALAQTRLEKATLRAPFSGILGLRRVSPGDYVKKGQDLVNLEALDPIKIDLQLPERYSGYVRLGQIMSVRVDTLPDKSLHGEIYAVDPRLDESSRSVLLRGQIPNPEGKLRPGMFACTTLILRERKSALWVPEQALVIMGNSLFVYRVVDGKAALVKVYIGLRRPGEVEVINGLTAGDVVITDGQMKLRDGMPVTVIGRSSANTPEQISRS